MPEEPPPVNVGVPIDLRILQIPLINHPHRTHLPDQDHAPRMEADSVMKCIGRYFLEYLLNGVLMWLSGNRQKLPCEHILPVSANLLIYEHQSPSVSTHSVSSWMLA